MWASAAACMRNYLILREKSRAFRADPRVQQALRDARVDELAVPTLGRGRDPRRRAGRDRSTPRPRPVVGWRSRHSTSWRSSTSTASPDQLLRRWWHEGAPPPEAPPGRRGQCQNGSRAARARTASTASSTRRCSSTAGAAEPTERSRPSAVAWSLTAPERGLHLLDVPGEGERPGELFARVGDDARVVDRRTARRRTRSRSAASWPRCAPGAGRCGAIAASRSTGPTTRCQRFSSACAGQLAHGRVVDTRPRRAERGARRGRARHPPTRASAGSRAPRRRPPRESAARRATWSSSRPSTRGPVSSTSRSRAGPKGRASVRSRWATTNAPGTCVEQRPEQRERRAQPPDADPGLVQVRHRARLRAGAPRWCASGRCTRWRRRRTPADAVDVGSSVTGRRLARLGIGAEVDRQSSSPVRTRTAPGTSASPSWWARGRASVYFGPSARSTVTTLRLSLTSVGALGHRRAQQLGLRRALGAVADLGDLRRLAAWRGRWPPCR